MSALVSGNAPWEPRPKSLCCPSPADECDCGYIGDWESRPLLTWFTEPGYKRSDRTCRRDIEHGLPPRAHDEGWWVFAAFEERCPGCGDVEHRDYDGKIVFQQRNAEFPDARIIELRPGDGGV